MKKTVLSLFIILFFVSCCACSDKTETPGNENKNENNESVSVSAEITETQPAYTEPTIYTILSNAAPIPGEPVTMRVYLCNVENLSSLDLTVTYDPTVLQINHIGSSTIPGFVEQMNNRNGKISYAGFVLTAANITNECLFELEIIAQNDSVGVHTIDIAAKSLFTTDEQGEITNDMTAQLNIVDPILNVSQGVWE